MTDEQIIEIGRKFSIVSFAPESSTEDEIVVFARALLSASKPVVDRDNSMRDALERIGAMCDPLMSHQETLIVRLCSNALAAAPAAPDHIGDAAKMVAPNAQCKGINCGCTDGVSHSAECQAEHAEVVAGAVREEAKRYFVYDHEGGYNEFKTDAEREQGHQAAIDAYLDTGCDGWSEEVVSVVSGIVTHKTVKTDDEHEPSPCTNHPDHDDESCDACEAWNAYPNHDFETCCSYLPQRLPGPASSDGDPA